MPTEKRILCPARRRRVPESFSWVDHRLVRDRYISLCSHEALSLYLFLVTVADADGLSYYADTSAGRMLNMSTARLCEARRELVGAGLVSYSRPLYQVLSLDLPVRTATAGADQGGAL
jgi:replication initiation and membrane attachment protein DnaB